MSTTIDSDGTGSTLTQNWATTEQVSNEGHYRVAAFPADYALTDDVILRDENGRAFLLSQQDEEPLPIEDDTANSLGMFFEPSQDYSWHTITELRRIIYGIDTVVVPLI